MVLFYYAEVKFSSSNRRSREDALDGGVKGEAVVTGRRQARLLTELGAPLLRPTPVFCWGLGWFKLGREMYVGCLKPQNPIFGAKHALMSPAINRDR